MDDFATLTYNGRTFKIPVITGTENERAIDIRHLRSEAGLVTLDPVTPIPVLARVRSPS